MIPFNFMSLHQILQFGVCMRNILSGVLKNTQNSVHSVDSMIVTINSIIIHRKLLHNNWYPSYSWALVM